MFWNTIVYRSVAGAVLARSDELMGLAPMHGHASRLASAGLVDAARRLLSLVPVWPCAVLAAAQVAALSTLAPHRYVASVLCYEHQWCQEDHPCMGNTTSPALCLLSQPSSMRVAAAIHMAAAGVVGDGRTPDTSHRRCAAQQPVGHREGAVGSSYHTFEAFNVGGLGLGKAGAYFAAGSAANARYAHAGMSLLAAKVHAPVAVQGALHASRAACMRAARTLTTGHSIRCLLVQLLLRWALFC